MLLLLLLLLARTGGGGGGGGGGVGGGGGGGGSVASVVSVDINMVNKVHRGLQQAFQGASPITSSETYMASLCTYKLQCNMWQSIGVDISLHTMDGDRTVFASTPQNKVWGGVWFSILSPLCKKGGNGRMDRMINKGDQGAEALAELQTLQDARPHSRENKKPLDKLVGVRPAGTLSLLITHTDRVAIAAASESALRALTFPCPVTSSN